MGGPPTVTNDVKPVIKSICYMEYVSSPRGRSFERTKTHHGLALWIMSSHIMCRKPHLLTYRRHTQINEHTTFRFCRQAIRISAGLLVRLKIPLIFIQIDHGHLLPNYFLHAVNEHHHIFFDIT